MLSRIAESLYWIGRYCERAEYTARVLDVHAQVLLEDRLADEESSCRGLLAVMGAGEYAARVPCDSEGVTGLLADDATYPGSIVRSIAAAWENARGAREVISSEMWESINTTYRSLESRAATTGSHARHGQFGWVKERMAILAGLADSTMSHDDGWRFMVVGRNLERVDMTARLLSARYGDSWGTVGWTTTLRSCAAHEAYLRSYRRAVDASRALEFLLLDRWFPRSAYRALSVAEGALVELEPLAARSGAPSEARRVVGRACAELEFVRVEELAAALPEHLSRLEQACEATHRAVVERYFKSTAAIRWSA